MSPAGVEPGMPVGSGRQAAAGQVAVAPDGRNRLDAARLLDLLASAAGLVLLSPLYLLIAVLIKLDSAGPVLHRGQRVGMNERPFALLKFRSMEDGAAVRGPGITAAADPRITRAGRLLRRTKLDELPQLVNVFKGEMSLVGPRPEDPRYVARYTLEQRQLLRVRPGVTSPASLAYRHEQSLLSGEDWEQVYLERVMPHKLQVELEYQLRRSVWTDLAVIVRTVLTVFR